jgi:hypothetical protein
MKKKRYISAIINDKKLDSHWGFNFNTDIQSYVENFMLSIHMSDSDYWLSYTDEAPEGVYTDVKVKPVFGTYEQLVNIKFSF